MDCNRAAQLATQARRRSKSMEKGRGAAACAAAAPRDESRAPPLPYMHARGFKG